NCRMGRFQRRPVAGEEDFPFGLETGRDRTPAPDPTALRRAVAQGSGLPSALPYRRRMVCSSRRAGDFRSVFSGARQVAQARAQDDFGGGRRDTRLVHETDAPRGRARLCLRVSALPEKEMATRLWTDVGRGNAPVLPPAS